MVPHAWSNRLHELGYVSGVYSSAASGIKMLDDARVKTPGRFVLPDQLWIADWNGNADVFSSYVRNDGWMPHKRVHQYRGGKPETFGGVTINIDRNWLDLGKGSVAPTEAKHCGGAAVYNYPSYANLQRGTTRTDQVRTLQCMLQGRGVYKGAINGTYGDATIAAVRAYRKSIGWQASDTWSRHIWMQLMTVGPKPVVKYGSARICRAQGPAGTQRQRRLPAHRDRRDDAVDGRRGEAVPGPARHEAVRRGHPGDVAGAGRRALLSEVGVRGRGACGAACRSAWPPERQIPKVSRQLSAESATEADPARNLPMGSGASRGVHATGKRQKT